LYETQNFDVSVFTLCGLRRTRHSFSLRYKSYYWEVKSGWRERIIYIVYEGVKWVSLVGVGNLAIEGIEVGSGKARCPIHREEGNDIH